MVKPNGVRLENVAAGAQVTSETWYANQIRTIGLSLNQQLTSQIEKFKLEEQKFTLKPGERRNVSMDCQ